MTYQALARKYRPRHFGEMVGQEHVLRALINALDNDRLHHAFLFTGTRGVGKTTIARILAKSLNCETGVSSKPCGTCSACREIDEGRFVDLIEVDAASRTKVDDTRELLDNVQYSPTRGRYKVYLVDEVHMLSNHSFNALLKTLEEPPPHVKFLFATTDPQKLPVTILSRCLQFSLKRMPGALIEGHLRHVLDSENVEADQAALPLVARAADGSMRDALSLLDQAIAFGGGALREAEVRAMLGTIERRHVEELLNGIAAGDGDALLRALDALDTQAPDYRLVNEEISGALQRVARLQLVPQGTEDWEDRDIMLSLASAMSPEDVQLYYQVSQLGQRELGLALDPRSAFEMLLLRMLAFRPGSGATDGGGTGAAGAKAALAASAERKPEPAKKASASPAPAAKPVHSATPVEDAPPAPWKDPDWHGLVDALGLRGVTQQLALNCAYERREGNVLHVTLAPQHAQMLSEQLVGRIETALTRFYREKLKLKVHVGELAAETPAQKESKRQAARQQAAEESVATDPNVKAMQEMFGASLEAESVRPLDRTRSER
ncbi:MAG: DNA polymerase III subunit gamma/tau [Proteobacteria bacterium]|nr:DNA polymerase III subunit gamma/tau [Pseudomonadota bacterium]